jgi:hypothetical protein
MRTGAGLLGVLLRTERHSQPAKERDLMDQDALGDYNCERAC